MREERYPRRPAEAAESQLITAILQGQYPPGSTLAAERELAAVLGVTRPTLREALQRLSRDGWIEIRQGKPTVVKDYLRQGNLLILNALARHAQDLPRDFIPQLLEVRMLLAPSYFRLALEKDSAAALELVGQALAAEEDAASRSAADWRLHTGMAALSGNPIFPMILNGFEGLLGLLGPLYFELPANRAHSRAFYQELLRLGKAGDAAGWEALTRTVMQASIENWQLAAGAGGANG